VTDGDRTTRPLRFAVIGAGMAGILSVIELRRAGYADITVYEKADGFGGTWRENTYPGLACDVPSHLYSYSFAPNPDWTHTFSDGAEIRAYFERVAAEHDVARDVRFGDEVTACTFADGRWVVETASGRRDTVDVVIAATGVLHHPNVPDIEGLDDFAGASFHSARWDHSVPLDGARVGVIGTGSTAVQITAALARRAEHFSLFQRTAQWVLPQANNEYSAEERERYASDPELLRTMHDNLAEAFGAFATAVIDADSAGMAAIEQLCRDNLATVEDPELRARLRPDYRAGCKRLVVSPDFYAAIQSPNAELVDAAIERIEPAGVRTVDGVLHELDVLVLATGFHADAFMRPMAVTGRGGATLAERWSPRPNAYLSISMPDFPNFFMVNGPNGPVGNFSLIEVAERQFGYILQLVALLRDGRATELAPSTRAMEEHEAARVEAAQGSIWVTGCNSWYLDDRGIPATWPWTFDRFREVMAAPDLDCYELIERH
jgi:cation diffusion facilitator CzcD-associated flavoprotein CzcO